MYDGDIASVLITSDEIQDKIAELADREITVVQAPTP